MRQIKIGNNSITHRSSVTEKFLSDVRKYKPLSHEEEIATCLIIKNGTESEKNAAREKLVLHNMRFVISVAKQYGPSPANFDDYIAFGYEGLIRATVDYDHTKGFKFISYAVWWIRQSIMLRGDDVRNPIKVPQNVLRLNSKIMKYIEYFVNKNGYEPSESEISAHFKISISKISDALSCVGMVSNDAQTLNMGEYLVSQSENLLDEESQHDTFSLASTDDARHIVKHLLAGLSKKNKDIITLAFDLDNKFDGRFNIQRVADHYGRTREMARRNVLKILRACKDKMYSRSNTWIKETLAD